MPKATVIGPTNVSLCDLAIDPVTGLAFGVNPDGGSSALYAVDLVTGIATFVGSQFVGGLNALDFSPDGTLYAMSFLGSRLYKIDTSTAQATALFDI